MAEPIAAARKAALEEAAKDAGLALYICAPRSEPVRNADIALLVSESDGLGEAWWDALLDAAVVVCGSWIYSGPLRRAGYDIEMVGDWQELASKVSAITKSVIVQSAQPRAKRAARSCSRRNREQNGPRALDNWPLRLPGRV
jgi:hypothetical protein